MPDLDPAAEHFLTSVLQIDLHAAPEASANTSAVKEKPKPVTLLGSTMARTPAGDALFVADEDRGIVQRSCS